MTPPSPFAAALGTALDGLPDLVREHFAAGPGAIRYEGVMRRVWRRGGLLGPLVTAALVASARRDMLFPESGHDVPFRIEHVLTVGPDGRVSMTWNRIFRFGSVTRYFVAVMRADAGRACIVDWLGSDGALEVDLHARVADGAVHIESGRQWLRLPRLRIELPGFVAGTVRVREWQEAEGVLGIHVETRNPLIGAITSYEGTFSPVAPTDDDPVVPPAVAARDDAPSVHLLALLAVAGVVAAGLALLLT